MGWLALGTKPVTLHLDLEPLLDEPQDPLILVGFPVSCPRDTSKVSPLAANFAAEVRRQKPPLWKILELTDACAVAAEQRLAAKPPGTPMLPQLAQGEAQPESAHV